MHKPNTDMSVPARSGRRGGPAVSPEAPDRARLAPEPAPVSEPAPRPTPQDTSRRILLIAAYYGPGNVTGGFRWNAMSRHLAEWGWSIDVITSVNLSPPTPWGPVERHSRIQTHVVPAPTWTRRLIAMVGRVKRRFLGAGGRASGSGPEALTPHAAPRGAPSRPNPLYRAAVGLANAARVNYTEWAWSRRAIRVARRLTRTHQYRAVVVSAPPHAGHLVGLALARRHGVPYVADLRDLWIHGMPELEPIGFLQRWLGARYEPQVFREARYIVCNTDIAKERVDDSEHVHADRTVCIPNGFDADGLVRAPDADRFRVVFTGRLYPFAPVETLFRACARLQRRAGVPPDRFVVEFMLTGGGHRGVPLTHIARRCGLDGGFVLHPKSSRAAAARLQREAAVLVAFDQSIRPGVPTKFYDYVQHRGAVLLIGNPRGALAAPAAALGLRVYDAADDAGIDARLDDAFHRWRQEGWTYPTDRRGIFDRIHQSRRFHELLSSLE